MGTATHSPPSTRSWIAIGAAAVLAVALVADTTFVTGDEMTSLTAPSFTAEAYVEDIFPELVDLIAEQSTPLPVLAEAVAADPVAAAEQYGNDPGGGLVHYPVSATGTVASVGADFITLTVLDMPADSDVRIPLGTALSGTPVRDATGTIAFGDFPDQNAYQSVAHELKLRIQTTVLEPAEPPSLEGTEVVVQGAVGPSAAGTWIIQPVDLQVAP